MAAHMVWSTKHRYPVVMKAYFFKRYRSLLAHVFDTEGVSILKGVVSKDYVHILHRVPFLSRHKNFYEKDEGKKFKKATVGIRQIE